MNDRNLAEVTIDNPVKDEVIQFHHRSLLLRFGLLFACMIALFFMTSCLSSPMPDVVIADQETIQPMHEADDPNTTNTQKSFDDIKDFMLSCIGDRNNPSSAIHHDIVTTVLDESQSDDVLQVTSIDFLTDDTKNPITVAILAATYDSDTKESPYATLYVVHASYDEETWEPTDFQIQAVDRLDQSAYPRLEHRGADYVYQNLYQNLVANVQFINREMGVSLPEPLIKKDNALDEYLDLGFAAGTPRFANVSLVIRPEANSAPQGIAYYVENRPTQLANDHRLDIIKDADWYTIEDNEESTAGYSPTETGLVGICIDIHVEDEDNLYKAHYTIDTIQRSTTLWFAITGGSASYYRTDDTAIYDVMLQVFDIDTDVTSYMIDEPHGPSLPPHREELKYLTPIVGDMPGGIVSIKAQANSEDLAKEPVIINDEDDIIQWAERVGKLLEQQPIVEFVGIPDIAKPSVIWDITLALHEGVGGLRILGYAENGWMFVEKTYRPYGTSQEIQQYFTTENAELFDALYEMSFGQTFD